jgi:hypothetical protein
MLLFGDLLSILKNSFVYFDIFKKRLKDDKTIASVDTNLKQNNGQQNCQNESQINHFIKWIQQDGFLYITFNVEEIYLHVKLGYCAR